MASQGWVSVHRQIKDKGWWKDSHYAHLFLHLLLSANHKANQFITSKGLVRLKPGQLITGRLQLQNETGINQSKVRRILKAFENEQMIEQQISNAGTLISIVNWGKYQKSEQQNDQQTASRRPAGEQQVDTNNNVYNGNNENKGVISQEQQQEYSKLNF